MDIEVRGIDHIYVTVSDLGRAEQFYDPVMRMLGYRKGTLPIGGTPHVHYFNRAMQYTLRPAYAEATAGGPAQPGRVGALHHLCLCVGDSAAVDEVHRRLLALGVQVSEPRLYPEYRADYYAIFFSDPDGTRLEVVCDTELRRTIREHWHEFTEFVDPIRNWRERTLGAPPAERALPTSAEAKVPNLWSMAGVPATGEIFQELARIGRVTIERIVSSEQPQTQRYDQPQDEWVVLLRGEASVDVAGKVTRLLAGDSLLLPAHTPHRVLETSRGATWLAVHVHPG
jgi:glyoxylase I family protein